MCCAGKVLGRVISRKTAQATNEVVRPVVRPVESVPHPQAAGHSRGVGGLFVATKRLILRRLRDTLTPKPALTPSKRPGNTLPEPVGQR